MKNNRASAQLKNYRSDLRFLTWTRNSLLTVLCFRSFRHILIKTGGFWNQPKQLEHLLISTEIIVRSCQQLVTSEDWICTCKKAQCLLGDWEPNSTSWQPDHCLRHHNPGCCNHPDHLPYFNWLNKVCRNTMMLKYTTKFWKQTEIENHFEIASGNLTIIMAKHSEWSQLTN